MKCFVYKSLRREQTYLYLNQADGFEDLPQALQQQFGEPRFVIEFELTPDRRLAREDTATVISNLTGQGYHLQLPPPDPGLLDITGTDEE